MLRKIEREWSLFPFGISENIRKNGLLPFEMSIMKLWSVRQKEKHLDYRIWRELENSFSFGITFPCHESSLLVDKISQKMNGLLLSAFRTARPQGSKLSREWQMTRFPRGILKRESLAQIFDLNICQHSYRCTIIHRHGTLERWGYYKFLRNISY